MGNLDGRVIAIAGAGGGLGPHVAARLADEGAALALTDVAADPLQRVAEGLEAEPDRVDARVVDLLDAGAAGAWAEEVERRFGAVDGLLHLVGGWRGGEPIDSAPLSDYEWLHDLLVRTVQHATRAFFGPLSRSEHGRFLLVSSAQAQDPSGTNAAYAAAKAAAEAWTLALADSFAAAESAATANIIVVNAILTPEMREQNPDKAYASFTPAERIAEACAFVCSDAAGRMNGKRLPLYP